MKRPLKTAEELMAQEWPGADYSLGAFIGCNEQQAVQLIRAAQLDALEAAATVCEERGEKRSAALIRARRPRPAGQSCKTCKYWSPMLDQTMVAGKLSGICHMPADASTGVSWPSTGTDVVFTHTLATWYCVAWKSDDTEAP